MHAPSDSLIPWAKRLGFAATVLAAAGAMQFGWAMGSGSWGKALVLGGFCVIATAVVGYALIFAHRAYTAKRWGVMTVAVILWVGAVCVELLGAFGFNAAARSVGIEQAQHVGTVNTDTRAELERARADLGTIKAGRPAAQIEANIKAWKARHVAEMERTAECTRPTGKPSSICNTLNRLNTELAGAAERARLDSRIVTLTQQTATASLAHSDVGAQNRIVASVATGTMRPSAEQEYWSFVAVAAAFAFFMVLSSLLNFLAFAFDGEPEPTAKSADIHQFPAPKPNATVPDDKDWHKAVLRAANG
jgi:hypothetical protein